MTSQQLKQQIADDITTKTAEASVTAVDVGNNMADIVDHIDDQVSANVQNNLLPSATMSPSVNAVNAGLESYANDVQAQIDEGIAGVYRDAGNYDASVGTFPTQTAQGNPIEAGNLFTVSVAGTLGGVNYAVGEAFRALVDTPGQTAGNWQKLIFIAGGQTVDTAGLVRKATDAEVVAGTANDNSVSTKQLQDKLDNLPSGGQPLTVGEVISANNNTALLTFGINQVYSGGASNYRVVLPDGVDAGTEKYLYIFDAVNIRGNAANTAVIKTGAASATGSLTAVSGQVYRFVKLDGNDWSYEILYGALPKYKSYVALISQSGTSAPTITQSDNGLGGSPLYSRNDSGSYKLTVTGAFTTNKTFAIPSQICLFSEDIGGFPSAASVKVYRLNANEVLIETRDSTGSLSDDILQGFTFEIRVYN